MAPTAHKPVYVKTKQLNVTKLQQLFLQQKFIWLVSLMNKLILFKIIVTKLELFVQKYSRIKFPININIYEHIEKNIYIHDEYYIYICNIYIDR